jgi:hypothetical protein
MKVGLGPANFSTKQPTWDYPTSAIIASRSARETMPARVL